LKDLDIYHNKYLLSISSKLLSCYLRIQDSSEKEKKKPSVNNHLDPFILKDDRDKDFEPK